MNHGKQIIQILNDLMQAISKDTIKKKTKTERNRDGELNHGESPIDGLKTVPDS